MLREKAHILFVVIIAALLVTPAAAQQDSSAQCAYPDFTDLLAQADETLQTADAVGFLGTLSGMIAAVEQANTTCLEATVQQEVVLREVRLPNANLIEINLRGADLTQATLTSARMRRADLQDAVLIGADLSMADLQDANLSASDLRGANLTDSNLQGVNLTNTVLDTGTILPDGTLWDTSIDLTQFTDPAHDEFWRSENVRSPAYRGIEDMSFGMAISFNSREEPPAKLPDACVVPDLSMLGLYGQDALVEATDLAVFQTLADTASLIQIARLACLEATIAAHFDLNGLDLAYADLRGLNVDEPKLVGADLHEVQLQGAYLEGFRLDDANLSAANLQGLTTFDGSWNDADFSAANLQGALLRTVGMNGVNLTGANLRGAYFHATGLVSADLTNADLRDTYFTYTTLDQAILRGADLRKAQFRLWRDSLGLVENNSAQELDLREANLAAAIFEYTTLCGSDLSDARLTETVFYGACLTDANLTNADLRGAIFSRSGLQGADFTGAQFYEDTRLPDGTFWEPDTDIAQFTDPDHPHFWYGYAKASEELQGVDLSGYNLRGAYLGSRNLQGTILRNADLREVVLPINTQEADLSDADLRGADAKYTNLENATLRGADMRGTDLFAADLVGTDVVDAVLDETTRLPDSFYWTPETDMTQFTDSEHPHFWSGFGVRENDLSGTDFSDANLRGAILYRTILQGADLSGANLENALLVGADLQDVVWDARTVLPDGVNWTPESDMERYTDPNHSDFWAPDWARE